MRIAVISMIRDPWGGSEELWYDMAKAAFAKGYEVFHLSYETHPTHPKMQELINKGLREFKRPGFSSTSKSSVKRFADKLVYFLRKINNRSLEGIFTLNPDVVIYNGTCFSVGREKKLIRLLNANPETRFFILAHLGAEGDSGLADDEREKIIRAYRRAEKVFFVSKRSVENSEQQLGSKIDNAAIVRNPVNLSDTSYISYPRATVPQMAIVGNFYTIHKGQDIALRILSKDEWRNRSWHLNIYGDGQDEGMLKAFVDKSNLRERVSFHGRVNDIRHLWANNQVLLMPSLMEGMPLSLVEAMICGRPSVVTDVGGNAEWVTDGEEGFIASKANDKEFEEALRRAFDRIFDWEAMGKMAHQKAMQLYDKNAGETLLNLIS